MHNAFDILDAAYVEHSPVAVYALLSGGDDSLATTAVTRAWGRERSIPVRVVHIDTGTGIPETLQFVRETCDRQEWPLVELTTPASRYEAMVLGMQPGVPGGFPGPPLHRIYYARLKDRRIKDLLAMSKSHRSQRVMLCSGLRQSESTKRMGYNSPINRSGSEVWCNPLFFWDKPKVLDARDLFGLPQNPASHRMHISGECLCGCMARPNELEELSFWFPDTAARIKRLERDVREAGYAWGWNERPPQGWRDPSDRTTIVKAAHMPLCASCEARL